MFATIVLLIEQLPGAEIHSIREIRTLPSGGDLPSGQISVHGIVTYSTPYELFIQDGTDALFVAPAGRRTYRPGEYVRVTGKIVHGQFAPFLAQGETEVIETRALPVAEPVSYRDLASGEMDCRWVEVTGVVRSVRAGALHKTMLHIGMPDGNLEVRVEPGRELVADKIIGAPVRARGVTSGVKNVQKQFIEPVLYCTGGEIDLQIQAPPEGTAPAPPLLPLGHLLQHGVPLRPTDLVRVRGAVLRQTAPDCLFIEDAGQRLQVQLQRPGSYVSGQLIEASGFPLVGRTQPLLEEALVSIVSQGAPPVPLDVPAADVLTGSFEGALVRVEARVRESFRRANSLVLVLAAGDIVFEAVIAPAGAWDPGAYPEIGSRVAVTGICQVNTVSIDIVMVVTPSTFRLLLQAPADVTVLQGPSWWTRQRLWLAVIAFSSLSAASGVWIWTLNRRVSAQTEVILGKAQSEAVLEERNRIAREFHDTLEQELAAVTIQLDAVAVALTAQPALAAETLTVARAMVRHSLDEAQRAVCDLRCATLGARTLPEAIEEVTATASKVHGLPIVFEQWGPQLALDSVSETHLLRIVQESVTNAVKYARASKIDVHLEYGPDHLRLEVVDDGVGLEAASSLGQGTGGFGIQGMKERALKLGARLAIQSEPFRGVRIGVSMPVSQARANPPPIEHPAEHSHRDRG